MKLSKGTVSVVDSKGISWSRVWCVYELFESLTQMKEGYLYDVYTAYKHEGDVPDDPWVTTRVKETRLAVGITQTRAYQESLGGDSLAGMVAVDRGNYNLKTAREQYFPIELIHLGISFRCQDGKASVEADRLKIMAEIGNRATLLNDTIHGKISAAALERVLKEGSDRLHDFLEAIKRSPPRELTLFIMRSEGDTQENVTAVIEALAANGANKCVKLTLCSEGATEIPSCVGELTALEYLDIGFCSSLVSLPESMGKMTALKKLRLAGCRSLVSLPESIGELTALEDLSLSDSSLVSLPESMGELTALKWLILALQQLVSLPESIGELTALERLFLSCSSLVSLPESMGQMTALKNLRLDGCDSLVSLPESIGKMTALEYLSLSGCSSLVSLPESIGELTALKELDLRGCRSLVSLPESMGELSALEKLILNQCSLVSLPESIGEMTALKELRLNDCDSLVDVPDLPGVEISR